MKKTKALFSITGERIQKVAPQKKPNRFRDKTIPIIREQIAYDLETVKFTWQGRKKNKGPFVIMFVATVLTGMSMTTTYYLIRTFTATNIVHSLFLGTITLGAFGIAKFLHKMNGMNVRD